MAEKKEIRHVIQCMPDGSVQMTLKDKELKPFVGHRKIDRMSNIIFDETEQKFHVMWKFFRRGITTTQDIPFDTYEDAVDFEIKKVNEARRLGTNIADRL